MQIVGHFIGLGSNQRRFHVIDAATEFIQRNVPKSIGKMGLQVRIKICPKFARPAHQVFPQPALALVNSGGSAVTQNGSVQAWRKSQFVKGMTGLMDGAENPITEIRLIDPRRDADVPGSQALS